MKSHQCETRWSDLNLTESGFRFSPLCATFHHPLPQESSASQMVDISTVTEVDCKQVCTSGWRGDEQNQKKKFKAIVATKLGCSLTTNPHKRRKSCSTWPCSLPAVNSGKSRVIITAPWHDLICLRGESCRLPKCTMPPIGAESLHAPSEPNTVAQHQIDILHRIASIKIFEGAPKFDSG